MASGRKANGRRGKSSKSLLGALLKKIALIIEIVIWIFAKLQKKARAFLRELGSLAAVFVFLTGRLRDRFVAFADARRISLNLWLRKHGLWHYRSARPVKQRQAACFAAMLLVTSCAVLYLGSAYYTVALEVKVNGQSVGYLQSVEEYDKVAQSVAQEVSKITGKAYIVDVETEFKAAIVEKTKVEKDMGRQSRLYRALYATTDSVLVSAYGIVVDGQVVGCALSKAEIDAAFSAILQESRQGAKDAEVEFLNQIEVVSGIYPRESLLAGVGEIKSKLSGSVEYSELYTVQQTDTAEMIAKLKNISQDALLKMNSLESAKQVLPGMTLKIIGSKPLVNVKVVKPISYKQVLPYETVITKSDKYYVNTKKLVTRGVKGEQEVTALLTLINGVQVDKTVVGTKVLKAPVTEKIIVGTKKLPSTTPTGKLSLPVVGIYSSRFGYRGREFHTGLDIAVKRGTAVKAADGGKVIFAGWKGNYGYLVIIDHGKGIQTYYAHNSRLLVKKGDKVYKGQAIAESGSTGRSSGPHVHFEIRINGNPVNPSKYVS